MNKILAVILGSVGLFAAAWASILAFAFAGAGHGWVSPLLVSLPTLLTNPSAGVAFAWSGRRWAQILGAFVFVLTILGDWALFSLTKAEGVLYFHKMWTADPYWVLIWATAWSYGQVLAVATLLAKPLRRIFGQAALKRDSRA